MKLFDIHTHNFEESNPLSIFNCGEYIAGKMISIGIHPWHISNDWKEKLGTIKAQALKANVYAIGECGIDRINSSTGIEEQLEVLKAHAQLSEETKKPLIIHCVKGFNEIMALHKAMKPQQAWIIHGFRGKPQLAEQLTSNGLYISFGEKFNIDSLKATAIEHIFIESDESNIGIGEIYKQIATIKGITIEELASATIQNAERCNIPL